MSPSRIRNVTIMVEARRARLRGVQQCAKNQLPATRYVSINIRCGHCRWVVFRRGSRSRGCGSRCSINCAGKSGSGGRAARRPGPSYGASSESRASPSFPQTPRPAAAIAAAGSTIIIAIGVSGARTCADGRRGLPAWRRWSRPGRQHGPRPAPAANARSVANRSRHSVPASSTAPFVVG